MANVEGGPNTNLDDSDFDGLVDPYFKECSLLTIKKLKENHVSINTTEKLESDHLNWQFQEINRKIDIESKNNQVAIKENEKLGMELYQYNGLEIKLFTSIQKTGKIINLINQEMRKLNDIVAEQDDKNAIFKQKLNDIKTHIKQKQTIRDLEEEIEKKSGLPDVDIDELLLKENEDFKVRIKEMETNLDVIQAKNAKLVKLREKKFLLLEEIHQEQEKNIVMKNNIEKINTNKEQIKNEMENKYAIKRDRLNEAIKIKEALQTELDESKLQCKIWEQEIESLRSEFKNKEGQLYELNEETEKKEMEINEIKKTQLRELEIHRELFNNTENNLEAVENEVNIFKKILVEKSQKFKELQLEKEKLITAVCEKKVDLLKMQCSHAQDQFKIDSMKEKLLANKAHIEHLNLKIKEFEQKTAQIREDNIQAGEDFNIEKVKVEKKHEEKIKALLNQQTYDEASIELMQNRLDNCKKKTEKLRKDIKECEADIKWDEIRLEVQKGSLKTIRVKVQKQQEELDKKLEDKKKNDTAMLKPVSSKEDVGNKMDTNEVVEEEDEEVTSASGRRSPGILKTNKSPKRPPTPNKRVKFEGIPSTDSSIRSEVVPKNAQKQLDDMAKDTWNKLVSNAKKKSGSRRLQL